MMKYWRFSWMWTEVMVPPENWIQCKVTLQLHHADKTRDIGTLLFPIKRMVWESVELYLLIQTLRMRGGDIETKRVGTPPFGVIATEI